MRLIGQDFSVTHTWPLVVRELRAESRRAAIYWLRLITAAVVVCGLAGFVGTTTLDASQLGGALFQVIFWALCLAMWIIVPMMTADCISREKREGTLGLLFLTPLTVLDVMSGKAATHVLRAVTLLLAAAPALVLPFVLGGVTWMDAMLSFTMIANALLLGIAAGLFASAKGGSAIHVMVMSEIYAACLAGASIWVKHKSEQGISGSTLGIFLVPAAIICFTGLAFLLVIGISVRVLRQTWDQDSASPETPGWVVLFSNSEFWRSIFHWETSRTLDNNPMAWLQEYSWTARLTKWGWLYLILVAEFIAMFHWPGWQPQLITVLSLGVAFSATGSFRRERQTGLLEILLVTPLTVRQLMVGRLWGVFSHFSPALAVLIVCWNGDRLLNHLEFANNPFSSVVPNPLAFGALMVVGLYLSLWRMNFLVVWMLTWVLAFFLPAFAVLALNQMQIIPFARAIQITSVYQVALALVCWFLMRRDMLQRRFVNKEGAF